MDLLREAKVVAAQHGTSLSALMIEGLQKVVGYDQSRRRIKRRLRLG
jgi:capsular polysaccharide biosynthesis protein